MEIRKLMCIDLVIELNNFNIIKLQCQRNNKYLNANLLLNFGWNLMAKLIHFDNFDSLTMQVFVKQRLVYFINNPKSYN